MIFVLISGCVVAQTEEELVKKIREQFAFINTNSKNFKYTEKEIIGETAEGTMMTAYYDNERLVLLHCEFFGEMGKYVRDYYYKDDLLFFVFTISTS